MSTADCAPASPMPKPRPASRPDALLAPSAPAPAPKPLAHAAPPRLCSSTCLGPPVAHGRLEASRSALGVCRKQSPEPRALFSAARSAGSHARGQPRAQQLRPALSDSGGCVCPALSDPAQLASVLRQFAHGPSRASPPRSLDIFRSLAVCGSALRTVRSLQSWQTSPSSPSWPPSRPLRALAKTIPTLVKSLAFGITIPTSCARPCVCRAVQSFVYCRAGSPTPAPTSFSVQRRPLSNAIPTLSLCLPPYGLPPAA